SICIHLEPALLRSLRHTDPALAAEPGLEALAWSGQPVVRSSRISRALAPEYGPAYRQGFAELPAEVQRDVLQRVTAAHAALGRSTEVTEVLIWQAHARQDGLDGEKEAVERAERWTQAWSALVEDGAASPLAASAGAYARDLLSRLGDDSKWMETQADWASRLVLTAGAPQIPAGLPAEALARAADRLRPRPGLLDLSFSTQGDRLLLAAVPGAATQAPDPGARITTPRSLVSRSDGSRAWLDRPVSAFQLAHSGTIGQQVWVRADALEYEFTELSRPSWACDWGRDRYGHFARIDVAGVRQTLRWIPPGRFLMGSPEDERDRYDDEGPQHQVTLTRGFWLADTACTQALWLAVLGGKNPSRFSGDLERPVEQVSWVDVTERFLPGLQRHLGVEVEAELPTEAEWEYACRAGTKTAYSFGEAFEPSRANVELKETVPVKAYPPNPWGQYQMHGNVWEWCADDRRPYGAGPVTDPAGDRDGGERALRGGAWLDLPRWVRSASRYGDLRDFRYVTTGFRFALRSIQGGAGGGMGRAEPGAGFGPAEPGRISGGVGTRHSPKS
ncbi:MAG TPA: formylglycine-generating enzyme family protein, partial [Zoogloea sp.]|nr:formylglycine-generating enzyme family protein [Zoogloea sp.]